MKECGVSVDKDALKTFFTCLGEQSLSDAQAAGRAKFIKMPCGGGGGARAAAGGSAPAEAVEEKVKEEEEAVDMGGLFGDEDEY